MFCAGHLILCWPLLQDLSGGNVMLTSSDTSLHGFCAKVADFGLARRVLCLSWAAAFPIIVQDALAVHGEVEPHRKLLPNSLEEPTPQQLCHGCGWECHLCVIQILCIMLLPGL